MICSGVFELPRMDLPDSLTTSFRGAPPINFRHALPIIFHPHTIS